MSKSDKYFADQEAQKLAADLKQRGFNWFNDLDANGYLDKLREMWAAYHGAYYSDIDDGHRINFGGEQGELANIAVNHLRNLCQHINVMITTTRPSLQARAVNTDYKSLIQARLANGLLDYYMREKRMEKHLKTAVEYAIVLGAGFIKMEWNATRGEIYDYIEPEPGEVDDEGREVKPHPIHEGDVQFTNLSPFDVVYDSTKETQDAHDWVLIRTFKNKFDLAAKYPELGDKIKGLPTKSDLEHYRLGSFHYDDTDDVPVYEFYHRKTESMPNGRYLLFLDSNIVLMDAAIPYRNLPIYRIAPADILGSPYGYTPMFDILPIQDAINMVHSTILTNQAAFGVQNVWVPRGSDITITQLAGGLNVIEGNNQFGQPEPLNLTNTPAEVFKYLEILKAESETISGVSSVARGNPEPSLKSGTALAMVQSMTIQFISGLQQSYIQLIEDVGTGLINMLKDFAAVPRIAAISGKNNRTEMKEFTGEDLASINQIIVDVGNPLARTVAGRSEMASELLQMGVVTNPEQYFSIINTGNLDVMTESAQDELLLIKAENEKLVAGEDILVIDTDDHSLHIREHKSVLADPDLRKDPALLTRTLTHIHEHMTALRQTDPDLLKLIQQQPLGPVGGTPAGGAAQPPLSPGAPGEPAGAMQGEVPMPPDMPPLPEQATPPPPFDALPTNAGDLLPEGG